MKNIVVIGAGSWGTAISLALNNLSNASVCLFARNEKFVEEVSKTGFSKYLPNISIAHSLKISADKKVINDADLIFWVVPVQSSPDYLASIKEHIKENVPIIICSKGIYLKTFQPLSEIFKNQLNNPIGVLSGPNFADEIAIGLPSASTLAFENVNLAKQIANFIRSKNFRIYANDDVKGVEMHGALKNVMAIAAGIVIGKKLGNNCLYALITRANNEIQRIVQLIGGKKETANTLAGIGDLMLTCSSIKSRNTKLGFNLSENHAVNEILEKSTSITEGVPTTKAAYEITQKNKIHAPIVSAVYDILYNFIPVNSAIEKLLNSQQEIE